MTHTGVVWDPVYLEHVTDAGHPDHPRRLRRLYDCLQVPSMADRFITVTPQAADDQEILLIHSPAYLNKVKATVGKGGAALSADTLTCDRSFHVAAMAAGGVIKAIGQVLDGTLANALVLCRPPGHHAERTRAMGFCIFNNVAIGAMVARKIMGLARVMVVDWDLHHGNGTQHAFERDPNVFFFSSHQFPHYPNTGHATETGLGPGEGTTMNVPLMKGCGDGEFIAIYQRLFMPVVRAFKPELILVSAGLDIHADDPLGAMNVNPAGFAGLTRLMLDLAREICRGRVVFCLEGGYDADAMASGVLAMIDEMTGCTTTDVNALALAADDNRVKTITHRCAHVHGRFWEELSQYD
ncbi:histone deacetylase family protein [Desulfosarcina variabilis str. Montpellier]|uniref:histone deacetylase family protein n=1 Tax=Desulfosarcina variabilis TaxID=2300 RepID=UPI003AFAB89D